MSASDDYKRLQLALEAAGLDLWENDLVAGKVTHPATRTFQELGYTLEEVGDSLAFWMEILHPDDLPGVGAALEAYRDGRADNYRSEFRLRSKDGQWVWYANYGKVMSGTADVGMHRFIGVTFNIDDRKQREEELTRINQLLSAQNQQLDQMNGHLEKLSTTDPLTQLCNRRAINERLHRLVSTGQPPSALLFIDLDNFKKINDLYGHDVGDILLCQVAQRLQSCVDAGDLVARFGGDEFVLVIRETGNSASPFRTRIEYLCARILSILAQPYLVGDLMLSTYGSIGVVCFPDDGWTVDELTKRADIALYRAKHKGRNRYCFFQPNMETELQYQNNIETELRTALKTRQLELLYQIQVDRNLRPVGAEALLRWHHPVRGLLSPLAFLPDAIAGGLIHDIDELVLDTACATLGKWQQDPLLRDLTLAVNITARSFEHPAFADTVMRMLEKYRLPAGKLCLELTEHLKAQSFPDAAHIIDQLRAHGVRFALDDFGTGYSSLEALKHLKFDQIKLDAAFVADITDNTTSQAIATGVIAIASAMQIEILAECVERHEQLEHLMRRGVDRYQGYLFGKPLPQSAMEAAMHSTLGAQMA
ncbi:EAL domain-containing protein [Uliginosibacterium sp. H3]|uniref:EAL domain-containing protein n=1 Tax=Uliginosibacterium silvisoli TaxID=3114758 RepID=A0ABU6K4I7_9RHOO|nr:EAL domain-containing protein [Uliginosibacterium sp. H3]